MSITVNTDVQFASGSKLGMAVANGKICLTLKVTDPAQLISIDPATNGIEITRSELAQMIQMGQAALPLFSKIALS